MSRIQSIQLSLQKSIKDVRGQKLQAKIKDVLNIDCGIINCSKIYNFNIALEDDQLIDFGKSCLLDPVTDEMHFNQLALPDHCNSYLLVSFLPGVTDDEGFSVQMALNDFFGFDESNKKANGTQTIFSQSVFCFENSLSKSDLASIAHRILGNPLINHFAYYPNTTEKYIPYVPTVVLKTDNRVEKVNLELADKELLKLSKDKLLSLNLAEMQAIKEHFLSEETKSKRLEVGLDEMATDCELEILGQTWSEHCKHKEFNAIIHFTNKENGEKKTINSLFKTYIKGSTDRVQENLLAKDNDWLVKVFSDNAGIVKINDKEHFVWKVETHNSPSALDPYGGAITGILGNNRDPLGTGIGGAKLLFNTNVLCFGPPNYDKPLLGGQLHPKQILDGVRNGIEDGGNKSGVPTVNGSIIFDDRYSGKPLVYCGTGGILKAKYQGLPTDGKPIHNGDRIIMAGGRVGKDGIHGATFSSLEIDEHSPMSAVQIGSPITQKKMADFLIVACEIGLVKCSTDNGAGGLSSSVGELATISGGAIVELEKVPLKYSGLKPWEIFISESQERMTLVIESEKLEDLFDLAKIYEVELSDIGQFTDSGFLDIRYNETQVAFLNMEFLHEGDPQKIMEAEWELQEWPEVDASHIDDYNSILLQLLSSLNICSRENVIRQFDHEVKGKTILKPLMGSLGLAPQDAAVMRVNFNNYEGIAVSNGILPRYGDIDAYEMSAGAFDEAMRQIISVGGVLPNQQKNDGIFWSVNDNFCVPDSEYHPETNPDGKLKLAKLVQMCEALYDSSTYFDIPMTSGKDSMKNDFKAEGQKISVPPTILYSMTAKINDIRNVVSSDFKSNGDLIYQLGTTYDEMGASEFNALLGGIGNTVPKVRRENAKALYLKVMEANASRLIESSHDISDGGLAITLCESCFSANFGIDIELNVFKDIDLNAILFSESHSRFVVSIAPENKEAFENIFDSAAYYLGTVNEDGEMNFSYNGAEIVGLETGACLKAWRDGGAFF